MPLINKRLIKEHSNNRFKVYLVDTDYCKNKYSQDFISGHSLLRKDIPRGEIWIIDSLSDDQMHKVIYYRLVEYNGLVKGLALSEARILADKALDKVDNNNPDWDKLIKVELSKINAIISVPDIFNGHIQDFVDGKSEHAFEMKRNFIKNIKCKCKKNNTITEVR